MITRVVKMEFETQEIVHFLDIFEASKGKIRAFKGCNGLKLLQLKTGEKNICFTYSLWDSEEALNSYRASELFKNTWAKTKVLFANKAEAWTLNELHNL